MLRTAAMLAMCALPMTLAAQGGMGGLPGTGGGRRGGMGGGRGGMAGPRITGGRSAPKFPSAKSLEKLNPAALLVDKRKKLKLADSTVAALDALRQRIFERNGDLMVKYDSLQRNYRPPTQGAREARGSAPDTSRRDAFVQMQQLRFTLDELTRRRTTDMRESLALIPEARKEDAAKILDKQDQKFADLLPVIPTRGTDGPNGQGRRGRPGEPPAT